MSGGSYVCVFKRFLFCVCSFASFPAVSTWCAVESQDLLFMGEYQIVNVCVYVMCFTMCRFYIYRVCVMSCGFLRGPSVGK